MRFETIAHPNANAPCPLTHVCPDNFEAAALPTTSPEERRRLLSFVVCGGGPTGVEAAAEIYDLCQEDVMRYYPKICREEVSIHVIQSREHILNTVSRPSTDRLTTEY